MHINLISSLGIENVFASYGGYSYLYGILGDGIASTVIGVIMIGVSIPLLSVGASAKVKTLGKVSTFIETKDRNTAMGVLIKI